jgi:DNA-binding MarR family transcriptional regulator
MKKLGSQVTGPAIEPDVRRVFDALRWIVRALRLAQAAPDGGTGLSAAQVFVLHVLKEDGPLSVVELAERTATDPSSVSVVVRKLHGRGLVGKRISTADRRKLKVALTVAGAQVAAAVPVPLQQVLLERLAQLAPDRLATLAELLEQVAAPVSGPVPAPMFFQDEVRARE